MKKFNLVEALAGKPVITRDGIPVTQLAVFEAEKSKYPVRGVLKGDIDGWTKDGAYGVGVSSSAFDLFMAPEKRTVYLNIYPDRDTQVAYGYHTELQANNAANVHRLTGKAIPFTFEV